MGLVQAIPDALRRMPRISASILSLFLAASLSGCQDIRSSEAIQAPSAVSTKVSISPKTPSEGEVSSATTVVAGVARAEAALADDWFEDVTAASGVNFAYRNGQSGGHFYILESLGGGAAVFDFDRDGNVDLFLTGGGTIDHESKIFGLPSALYRNDGQPHFQDVSVSAGVANPGDYSHGCFLTDFDCDGFADVFVTAYGRCRLFQNRGDGSFEDISTLSGLDGSGWWTAAAWGDVDRDGLPDVFVTGYLEWSPDTDQKCHNATRQREVCGPNRFPAANDRLYRNRGDGSFEDMTSRVGLKSGGNGLGVVAAQINGDNFLDFYVANDESENFLYLGQADGTLQEAGQAAGVAVNQYGTHEGSMGVEAGDYDGDGRCDLWVTNFELEDNALYRNLDQQLFKQTTNVAGLAGRSRLQVGFGTALEDFNGDGWLDLLVVNGHVFYAGGQLPYRQKPQLFRNSADSRFEEVSGLGGIYFRREHPGRGTAVGDFDNDGGLDIIVVHQNEPVTILRNRFPPDHFVSLEIVGTQTDRDAVGTTVTSLVGDNRRVRFLRSGAGYLSSFDRRVVMAVKNESTDVEVRWPDGTTEKFRDVPTGTTHPLIQGRGRIDVAE